MNYTEDSLVPAMQHIAKNVLKVNEGQTKHMVSIIQNCHCFITLQAPMISVQMILQNVPLISNVSLFQTVKNKYSSQKQMRIATISQLKSSLIKDLAKQLAL